ncbi:hypothetical protein B0H14DRAFT_3779018 [Mycena olivaceomarginata]|nr:hypothetical protein B0H14DRAFT_3779018 [Mycena olivaceomarginata]
MLEEIRPPSAGSVPESVNESYEYAGSDRSSVMMYSPLIPNADSVIELADVEEVPVVESAPSSGWGLFSSWPDWSNFWLFNGWKANNLGESETPPPPISATTAASEVVSQNEQGRVGPPVRRVWVPSTTQLSFETTWWGYRMCAIPQIVSSPPVLAILDDQSVEAAKQATVITAALTWFFSNPPRPAIILLQRLVPLVSYLGTFISWSWGTIRGFDRGHGVILTATWLLPIALIPGTWHARDSFPLLHDASQLSIPLPPAPAPAIKPLPPCPDGPPIRTTDTAPPLKQRKSSTSGKSKIRTLRKPN